MQGKMYTITVDTVFTAVMSDFFLSPFLTFKTVNAALCLDITTYHMFRTCLCCTHAVVFLLTFLQTYTVTAAGILFPI